MRSSFRTAVGLSCAAVLGLSACADGTPLEPSATPSWEGGLATHDVAPQATPPGFIRIGVVPSATSVTLGADGAWQVRDKATGAVLFGGTGGGVTASLHAAAEVRTRDWFQVTCTGSPATVTDLVTRGAAAGFETRTEDLGFCVRVLFGTLPAGSSSTDRSTFQAALAAAGLPSTGFWRTITVVTGAKLLVRQDDVEVIAESPVVIESADGVVRIAGQPYRGLGEAWTNSAGAIAGINELPIEEYLYGVVPRELPPVPYGAAEAQKAQAVAARTYALANLGKRAADGYDLLPTTSDQVYGGLAAEHPISTAAVDATAGVVAVHEGSLITTLYHSTSGGWTANSEDVYTAAIPYLRGLPDAERGEALGAVPSLDVFVRNASATNLRALAEGDYESDWSIYHRWVVGWSAQEMAAALTAGFGTAVTRVDSIRVTDRAAHGRVRRIEFYTDAGTLVGVKDAIRSRLPYFTGSGARASLRSTLFFIEESTENGTVTGWKAWGGGWGHGVGMSQTGAVGMATRGRSYQQILAHYYQGSTLETRAY